MKELDFTIAQARRLYLHYSHVKECKAENVAYDFSSLIQNLEYVQAKLHDVSSKA